MKPCAVCKSDSIGPAVGIQWNSVGTKIAASVLACPCGNTRYLEWENTPEPVRVEAILAEQARIASSG